MSSTLRSALLGFLFATISLGNAKAQGMKTDSVQAGWWNNTVFYEVFVRSFFDSDGDGIGDFNGLTQKLDYLNDGDPATNTDLGVGGLWLMPINPSPSYHGYDVTDYKDVNPEFGTLQDFQNFLQAAHDRGIKVIIDMVINHSSSQHPWFVDSRNDQNGKRNYYRWSGSNPGYSGPWGQQVWHFNNGSYYYGLFWGGMPDLNYNEIQVRDSIFDIARYWLDDIGVDGFRLDAVKYIYEAGSNLDDTPATIQFWKDYKANAVAAASNSLLVGEAWTNTSNVLPYVENGGLDFCFEFDLAEAILDAVNNADPQDLVLKMDEVYTSYPDQRWGTFLTNHDMDRAFNDLGQSKNKSKVAASIYLCLPGVPFLYYGEEIGMLGQKPDPDIRRPMQWTPGQNAGFSTGVPWGNINSNYATYNVATEMADPESILRRYQQLIAIRNAKSALQTGNFKQLPCNKPTIFSFLRAEVDDTALVVINLSSQIQQELAIDLSGAALPGGQQDWWEMLQQQYKTVEVDSQDSLKMASLAGYGVNIFSLDRVIVASPEPFEEEMGVHIHPNPAQNEIEVSLERPAGSRFDLEIYDLKGQKVISFHRLHAGIPNKVSISDLSPGTYVLVFQSKEQQVARRLVKK